MTLQPQPEDDHGRLSPFDRDMAKLVISWAPYGGPPEHEVLPEFGISRECLLSRVDQMVDRYVGFNISPHDRALVLHARHAVRITKLRFEQMTSPTPPSRFDDPTTSGTCQHRLARNGNEHPPSAAGTGMPGQ